MRTRAQTSRDAALRRLTRVNHSLAVAAVLGAGVITDVVAHTASGHPVTSHPTPVSTSGNGQVGLLSTSAEPPPATASPFARGTGRSPTHHSAPATTRRQTIEQSATSHRQPHAPDARPRRARRPRPARTPRPRQFGPADGRGGLRRQLSRCRSPRSAPHPRRTGI